MGEEDVKVLLLLQETTKAVITEEEKKSNSIRSNRTKCHEFYFFYFGLSCNYTPSRYSVSDWFH